MVLILPLGFGRGVVVNDKDWEVVYELKDRVSTGSDSDQAS